MNGDTAKIVRKYARVESTPGVDTKALYRELKRQYKRLPAPEKAREKRRMEERIRQYNRTVSEDEEIFVPDRGGVM